MISNMSPEVQPGEFAFISTQDKDLIAKLLPEAIGTFQEAEGLSLLVPLDLAGEAPLSMKCITLRVYSSLEGVGLTAAVSSALGEHHIPCNMVAAYNHDHVFIPADKCDQAMAILKALQRRAANTA
ncbi:ACT domain-containing protein [Yoonia sp. GPGPB17]|uniref:ACT domain-containing protein n=1 Tax=Yoonia sp. GPGPB17 TaxID=3026147 RepID=UPI0030BCD476